MTKEQKDLAWSVLPKETRDIMKSYWNTDYDSEIVAKEIEGLLDLLFGHHNLTSDEEPEEIFVVSKKTLEEKYNAVVIAANTCDSVECAIIQDLLEEIFNKDKCLPDPSEAKPTPKFKVGDKVMVVEHKSVSEIDIIGNENKIGQYHVKYYGWFKPEDIIPYTEPEPQQTEENMEEKELNLCELLVNQYNDSTYSPIYGEVDVTDIACDRLVITPKHSSDSSIELFPDGRFSKNGDCQLWPSRDLYLKYPLEAAKAWSEWAESRKPKRWYPEFGERLWCLDLSMNPSSVTSSLPKSKWEGELNCFRTEELCQQAAEAVKRTLEEFHENNAEK